MTLETNKIKEIAPGVYWVLFWCPESSILSELLDQNAGYIVCWDHYVGNNAWQEFLAPVFDPVEPIKVSSRLVNFDFLMPTGEFREILPRLRPTIKAVQIYSLPPNYLDMRKIHGKQLYRLLNECGWHVLLDTPANDYGEVMSPKREVLERAIEIMSAV